MLALGEGVERERRVVGSYDGAAAKRRVVACSEKASLPAVQAAEPRREIAVHLIPRPAALSHM